MNLKNRVSRFHRIAVCSSVIAITLAVNAAAAAPREGSGGADMGMQRLLRQLTAERDQLAAEKLQLTQELEEKDKELKKLSKTVSGKEKSLEAFKSVDKKLRDRLLEAQNKLEEMNLAYLQKEKALYAAHKENDELLAALSDSQLAIEQHIFNNRRLLEINEELLGKYHDKGFLKVIAGGEPFTKINQVVVENIMQDYQFELEDLSTDNPADTEITVNY